MTSGNTASTSAQHASPVTSWRLHLRRIATHVRGSPRIRETLVPVEQMRHLFACVHLQGVVGIRLQVSLHLVPNLDRIGALVTIEPILLTLHHVRASTCDQASMIDSSSEY